MNHRVFRFIRRMKRPHHNVFGMPQRVFHVIVSLCISIWTLSLFDVHLRHLPESYRILVIVVGVLIPALTVMIADRDVEINNQSPYCRKDGFEFLGLHNLKDSNLVGQHDVLPRDEESAYMHRMLEEVIFPQTSVKQALCITGPSGCGKSTILNIFRQTYQNEYKIFDFSGNYHEFYGHMVSVFGTNMDQRISQLTSDGKIVFILDQFERFFFLSKKEQDIIRNIIHRLCREKTGIIVSLREEYLADFLKRFDMNNLMSSSDEGNIVPRGILRELYSVIEKRNERSAYSAFNRPRKTIEWEYHRIKNNMSVHLDTSEKGTGKVVMEEMGATLLYCLNQNEMRTQFNAESSNASILESKCKLLFGDMGTALYRKHAHESLIEQQIIYHMAEFNQKILLYPEDELSAFIAKDDNELLGRYFDFQLASCVSFFHASRLLYLLSQARLNQLSMTTRDVENCLFPEQFSKKGHKQMMIVIDQLEKLQLIRKNTEGSNLEYEIAHDFIASAYLNYCSIHMNRDLKNALDLFIAEYMDEKRKLSGREKISHRKAVFRKKYYQIATVAAVLFMTASYIVQLFFYNPWTEVWSNINPYGSYLPILPYFITVISVIYLCYMYDKMVKYYRGGKENICKIVYVLLMFIASMAVFAYPHFLLLDGFDLALAAINIGFLLDSRYQQTCRNELSMYGLKSGLIGIVFAGGHLFFFLINPQFDDYLILTEFIMFTFLVAYAFLAHMTQEFLFARMCDASSEQL